MHLIHLLFVDLLLIAASTLAAAALCSDAQTPLSMITGVGPYFLITLAISPPVLLIFGLNRTVWRFTSLSDCVPVAGAALGIVLIATSASFLFDRLQGIPRSLPIMQTLLMLYALWGARAAMRLRHSLRRRARRSGSSIHEAQENVLLIGLNPITNLFLHCTAENGYEHIKVAGILSEANRHHGRLLRSCKILGLPEAAEEVVHDLSIHGVRVHRIVLTTPVDRLSAPAKTALRNIESTGAIRIDYLSARYGLSELTSPASTLIEGHISEGAKPAPASERDGEMLPSSSYLRWKRVADTAGALICIIPLAPLMLLVGLVVVLDIGYPPIFWQQRPGALGRPIRVLKFRTMGPARDQHGRAIPDAERVSMVGRLLRRLRLDELPQIYNVLLGHMSFVGPRPLLPVDQPSSSSARLQLRPGLTGWAQIKGGRHLSVEDKAALDIWYIKNASFALDIAILANTARTVLFGERIDLHAIDEAWRDLGHSRSTDSA